MSSTRKPKLRSLRRTAVAATSAALAGVLLAACGSSGGSGSGSTGSGPVRIKVWAWYPQFKQVVDQFNRRCHVG
jgi:multiple sugar transport system substrate-binding protein